MRKAQKLAFAYKKNYPWEIIMKNLLIKGMIFLSPFIFFQCSNQITGPEQSNHIALTDIQKKVASSSDEFGLNLLEKLNDTNKESNIFISPLSVSMALGMTMNGAKGTTLNEMENTLGFTGLSQDEINQTYNNLMQALTNADPNVTMQIANSIWYKNTFSVEQKFKDVNKNYFNAAVQELDFSNPSSVNTINNWVSQNTNGKITGIISQIPSNAVMYLINAIYFNGNWKYQFDSTSTVDKPFYLSNGNTVTRKFMREGGNFNYFSNSLVQAIDLPYGDSTFSMMVILPNQGQDINSIVGQLNMQTLDDWINQMCIAECNVTLPKFKIECEYSLSNQLIAMGMKTAFSASADFTGISKNGGLYISEVKHKTYINVNEQGTEAAAVTLVGVVTVVVGGGGHIPIEFNVNRPFLFVIKENSSNTILFAGKIMDPVQN